MAETKVELGPDGEPIPKGTPAQVLAGVLIASTFNKKVKENLDKVKEKYVPELKKGVQVEQKPEPVIENVKEVQQKQNEVNKAYKELTEPGHTQSMPNQVAVPKVKVEGEGNVTNP